MSGKNTGKVIEKAVKILNSGGAIIYPTETCYGVGVDATNKKAVEKLLQYKERPEGKAISIAVSSFKMAKKYVDINQTAQNIYNNFLPGPITVVSKSKGKAVKDLEAENGTLGVRMPDYVLAREIIKLFGKPITATSANASGQKTPYKIADILNTVSEKKKRLIDLIIDAGDLPHNPPSTVVDTTLNDLNVLRKGKVDLSSFSKKKKIKTFTSSSEEETQEIAQELMDKFNFYDKCLIFALQGELGVGKTQFAKGVGKALGIKENIKSPTFTLVCEYKFKFYHIDTWRMREGKELMDLGFEKMIKPGNVIVIEWLEKVKEILEQFKNRKNVQLVWVKMEYSSENKRRIAVLDNRS
ncbi:MAG: Translation factor SUA5 [Candidatus Levybacteria bacterium GW2011_GWA2_40_8]|nr:MAG: Translation factor SUA5 [Candidatus Levybacteria bacterium GW2011_GWA2_40_8]